MTSVWLWLEWVRVERGRIVLHVEIVQPIEITQHESRSEPRRAPFTRIVVNSYGAPFEPATRGKEMAIMFKIVYPNFESVRREFFSQIGWDAIVSLRHKIEGRAKPKLRLQLH